MVLNCFVVIFGRPFSIHTRNRAFVRVLDLQNLLWGSPRHITQCILESCYGNESICLWDPNVFSYFMVPVIKLVFMKYIMYHIHSSKLDLNLSDNWLKPKTTTAAWIMKDYIYNIGSKSAKINISHLRSFFIIDKELECIRCKAIFSLVKTGF